MNEALTIELVTVLALFSVNLNAQAGLTVEKLLREWGITSISGIANHLQPQSGSKYSATYIFLCHMIRGG